MEGEEKKVVTFVDVAKELGFSESEAMDQLSDDTFSELLETGSATVALYKESEDEEDENGDEEFEVELTLSAKKV